MRIYGSDSCILFHHAYDYTTCWSKLTRVWTVSNESRPCEDGGENSIVGIFYRQYYLWGRSSDLKRDGSTRRGNKTRDLDRFGPSGGGDLYPICCCVILMLGYYVVVLCD